MDQPERDLSAVDPWRPDKPTGPVAQYKRRNEPNPYKRLGLPEDASFDEVIDARAFLVEQFAAHAPSVEAVEQAYEVILKENMKYRKKFGFQPPSMGRKTDMRAQKRITVVQWIKSKIEPSVPSTTVVNDGSIFLVLAIWAGLVASTADPALPLGGALVYCIWRLFSKRKARSPEGPYWGNSPVWGALFTALLGLFAGSALSFVLVSVVPLPAFITADAFGLGTVVMSMGLTCMYIR